MIFHAALRPARTFAGNLRHAAAPAAVIDRHFQNAQARGRDAHLHFEIPAIGFLAHAEAAQLRDAHGAERRHVGEAHAIDEPHQRAGEVAGDELLRRHAAGFAVAAQARAHDEIRLAPRHRRRRRPA